jgi:transcriptional regulator with XRE-family HTH domain
MPDSPETMGQRIAALRERRGWKQKALADRADISSTFLSEIEKDKRNVSSEILLRIATVLGTSMDYLMRGAAGGLPPEEPLVIPLELNAAAESQGWSHRDTILLLRAHLSTTAVARRRPTGELAARRVLGEQDWIALHKVLIGDD